MIQQCHPSAYIQTKWKLLSRVGLFMTPMDYSPPGSFIHGILQARILEWTAISFFTRSFQPRDQTQISHTTGRFFSIWATREVPICQLLMWTDISFPTMNLEEVPWVKPLHCPTPSITSLTRAQGRASVLKAEWDVFIKQQIHICFLEITPNLTLICANHKIISHGQPTLLIALVEGHLGQLPPFRVSPCF